MRALVIVCVYNEGVKLEKTAERIYNALRSRARMPPIDVLLADDGSTDSTPQEMSKKYNFRLFRHPERKGIGHLIRDSYRLGRREGYDILITMAGNNKDEPTKFDRLIDPIYNGQADFVQGSRYLAGGNFGNMPLYRQLATRFVHPFLFSVISGQRITDSTNGFRAVRTSILDDKRMDLDQDWLNQYELEPYLFCQAIRLGYRVREVPVSKIYPDKKLGYSKMKPITGWWSILKPLFYLWLRLKK